jgi:WD40 repeat protein
LYLLSTNSPCPLAATLELVAEKSNAHISVIASVAFSPDGKTIVSGSWDQTLKVWSSGGR